MSCRVAPDASCPCLGRRAYGGREAVAEWTLFRSVTEGAHRFVFLPIVPVLPELFAALDNHTSVILQAPRRGQIDPAALELVRQHRLPGRIIMLEPRAPRGAQHRELPRASAGEKVGERIGLRVRGRAAPAARPGSRS